MDWAKSDEMRIIWVLRFGVAYIRDVTVCGKVGIFHKTKRLSYSICNAYHVSTQDSGYYLDSNLSINHSWGIWKRWWYSRNKNNYEICVKQFSTSICLFVLNPYHHPYINNSIMCPDDAVIPPLLAASDPFKDPHDISGIKNYDLRRGALSN